MSATTRLSLPYLAAAQAQKHVTHNEALDRLDSLMHLSVVSRQLAAPPASALAGTHYIPASGASGAWTGLAGQIVTAEGNGWVALPPSDGMLAFIVDEDVLLVFKDSAWQATAKKFDALRVDRLGLDTAPHATAGMIMAAPQAIFSHDEAMGGNAGVSLIANKASAAATASVIFQTAWQGRAELGLCGDDNLSMKVSPDGSNWKNALLVDRSTGNMRMPGQLVIGEGNAFGAGLSIGRNSPYIVVKDTLGIGNAHTSIISFLDKDGVEKVWMGLGSMSNSEFSFLTHYPDGLSFMTYGGSYPIKFMQNGASRITIHPSGNVGIRENNPTTPLHVNGALRLGSFGKASLPSAATLGAGSVIFVPDDAAGATLAFSDGAIWRRVHDRQQVA